MSDTYYDTKLSLQLQRRTKFKRYDQLTGRLLVLKTELPLNVFLETIKGQIRLLKTFDTGDFM